MSTSPLHHELSTMMNNGRPENYNMRRLGLVLSLLGLATSGASFVGCGSPQPAINTVGVNVIEKSTFAGSWYMTEQIIDFDYEAAGLGFVGEISGDGTAGGYGMARVRWVIDEETLYAYRDYLAVPDAANPLADQSADFLGQPIAAPCNSIDRSINLLMLHRNIHPVKRVSKPNVGRSAPTERWHSLTGRKQGPDNPPPWRISSVG